MATDSASEPAWQVAADGRSASVLIRLRQRSYVFPWSLFLGAEGTDAEVRLIFHTHVVSVQGAGLTALLGDLATQSVSELIEPDRSAKFTHAPGPCITALTVIENK